MPIPHTGQSFCAALGLGKVALVLAGNKNVGGDDGLKLLTGAGVDESALSSGKSTASLCRLLVRFALPVALLGLGISNGVVEATIGASRPAPEDAAVRSVGRELKKLPEEALTFFCS